MLYSLMLQHRGQSQHLPPDASRSCAHTAAAAARAAARACAAARRSWWSVLISLHASPRCNHARWITQVEHPDGARSVTPSPQSSAGPPRTASSTGGHARVPCAAGSGSEVRRVRSLIHCICRGQPQQRQPLTNASQTSLDRGHIFLHSLMSCNTRSITHTNTHIHSVAAFAHTHSQGSRDCSIRAC
jgi:hypothetical protein